VKNIKKASAGNVRALRESRIKIEASLRDGCYRDARLPLFSAGPPNYYTAMANRKLDSGKAINLNLHMRLLLNVNSLKSDACCSSPVEY